MKAPLKSGRFRALAACCVLACATPRELSAEGSSDLGAADGGSGGSLRGAVAPARRQPLQWQDMDVAPMIPHELASRLSLWLKSDEGLSVSGRTGGGARDSGSKR